jgi:hypothetical protein
MIALPPNPRYERKLIAQRLTLTDVLAVIRRHPAMFREAFPPRIVNNIYLDTPSLSDYHDHLHGAAHRVKTRIRWYGGGDGPIETSALERKIKRGLVGGKVSYPLPSFVVGDVLTRHGFLEMLARAALPEALRQALLRLEPALANRYRRHYYQSADRRFRMTIDTDLSSSRPGPAAQLQRPSFRHAPGVIVELKFEPRHADDAADVTNALPFRLTRFSKYVAGIQQILCGW